MSDSSQAVFLSYASQDAEAAKRICDALRAAGVEVWFDQSELVGGDQWDGKIRGQISSCALFVPVISANTQARLEGYFRLEWKLAGQRTHTMADEKTFLLPVVIDGTRDAEAKVPAEFKSVQWTKLIGGESPVAFAQRVKRLLEGDVGPVSDRPSGTAPLTDTGQRPVLPPKSPRWLAPVIAGAVVALVALAISRPWAQRAAAPANPVAAPVADPAAAAELGQLRARIIPDQWQKEDFEAVAPVLDRFILAHPDSADAYALRSLINSLQVTRNFDAGTKPLVVGKTDAERALRLAPQSPLAELAMGMHLVAMISRGGNAQACRPWIDRAIAALPRDRLSRYAGGVSRWLCYDFVGTERELADWLAADPQAGFPKWILAQCRVVQRRPDEAEQFAREAARDEGITGIRARYTLFESSYYLRADLAACRAALQGIPTNGSVVHRVVHARWLVNMAEHHWDAALQELVVLPENFLYDRAYHGPKALLAGLAHERAGRAEAAKAQYREAERLLREHLAGDPDNEELHAVLALTLACLGRAEEARGELAQVEPLVGGRAPNVYRGPVVLLLAQTRGVLGDYSAMAPWVRKLFAEYSANPFTPASFSHDARFSTALAAPEIAALLKEFAQLDLPVAGKSEVSAPIDLKSVAVLAFANLSDDKGNEYFSDGISEELLNVLAKIPGLKVTARTSSFHFKGTNTAIPEIAQQLGVAYVIEGSVRKQGDKVRITAQLIKATDGFHVWSDTFTRDLKDIFAVQDEIAGLIAQQLQLKLSESTRVAKVVNPEAYRLLLEGRQFWNLRSEEGFTKAEVAFGKALAIDPQFAEAHAGLGGVCVIRAIYHELDDVPLVADDLPRAVSEGRRALDIDPSSADALAVLGYAEMMRNQLAESDRHFQQALELNPSSALVHCWYALLLNAQGRLDDALRHAQKAAEVDPLWFINLHMMGEALAFAQRYDQALGILERAEALRTEVFLPTVSERARALLELGRKEEAFTAARQILRNHDVRPRWGSDPIAIQVLVAGGRRQEAEDEVTRLFARYPRESYQRGFILAALGRFDEALPFLQRTPSTMNRHIYWDKMWDPWREDPRFLQLMAQLGRAEEYKVARATLARMQAERK